MAAAVGAVRDVAAEDAAAVRSAIRSGAVRSFLAARRPGAAILGGARTAFAKWQLEAHRGRIARLRADNAHLDDQKNQLLLLQSLWAARMRDVIQF